MDVCNVDFHSHAIWLCKQDSKLHNKPLKWTENDWVILMKHRSPISKYYYSPSKTSKCMYTCMHGFELRESDPPHLSQKNIARTAILHRKESRDLLWPCPVKLQADKVTG